MSQCAICSFSALVFDSHLKQAWLTLNISEASRIDTPHSLTARSAISPRRDRLTSLLRAPLPRSRPRARVLLDVNPSQSPVLCLELPQLGHHLGVHAAELAALLIDRRGVIASPKHISGTEFPDSTCLSASMIWLSVNRDVLP